MDASCDSHCPHITLKYPISCVTRRNMKEACAKKDTLAVIQCLCDIIQTNANHINWQETRNVKLAAQVVELQKQQQPLSEGTEPSSESIAQATMCEMVKLLDAERDAAISDRDNWRHRAKHLEKQNKRLAMEIAKNRFDAITRHANTLFLQDESTPVNNDFSAVGSREVSPAPAVSAINGGGPAVFLKALRRRSGVRTSSITSPNETNTHSAFAVPALKKAVATKVTTTRSSPPAYGTLSTSREKVGHSE